MNTVKQFKKHITDFLLITFACVVYSLSFSMFFHSNELAMGGFTGLSQIINLFFPFINIGTAVFVLNLPLMIIGFRKEGFKLLLASFYTIFLTSFLIDIFDTISFPKINTFLACIFGSVLLGISLGLLMLKNATTGGTELLARLIKDKFPNLSIGKVCLIIDVTVICIYALCFKRIESALYGIIAMYISSTAMDTVVYGNSNGKLAYIISDKNDLILKELLEAGLGVTVMNGNGGHLKQDKKILLCAIKKSKMAHLKKTVAKYDPEKAFVIVCDAKEVFGEGFADYTGTGF